MDSIQKMINVGTEIAEIDEQLAQQNRRREKLIYAKVTNDPQGKTHQMEHTEEGKKFI